MTCGRSATARKNWQTACPMSGSDRLMRFEASRAQDYYNAARPLLSLVNGSGRPGLVRHDRNILEHSQKNREASPGRVRGRHLHFKCQETDHSGEGAAYIQVSWRPAISNRVAVIGGGVAGIVCACELADAGAEVVLLEAKENLGGRAHSFQDRETGAWIDNCQHVLLGCCDEAIGVSRQNRLARQDRFPRHDQVRGTRRRGASVERIVFAGPVPPGDFAARIGLLHHGEKVGMARALWRATRRPPAPGENAADYLRSISCPKRVVERMMEPVLVSALNEDLDSASGECARMVILKALVEGRNGYRLGVPMAPLAEVLDAPASRYLALRGCRVRTATRVESADCVGPASELDCAPGRPPDAL